MEDPQEKDKSENQQSTRIVPRARHFSTGLLLAIIGLCVIVWFFKEKPEPIQQAQTESQQEANKTHLSDNEAMRPKSFNERLDAALYDERRSERDEANRQFQDLLLEADEFPRDDPRVASLLARAASFYAKGKEISQEEVERLYLDSIDAIELVHGQDYYDLEHMHQGLEQLYQSMGRFQEAAVQSRRLVEFYQRQYKTDSDVRYALVIPTLIRLGDNLVLAGQVQEARKTYETTLDMVKARGSDMFILPGIQDRLNKLSKQDTQ